MIPTANHSEAVRFYRDTLDFEPIFVNSKSKDDKEIAGFKVNRFLTLFLTPLPTSTNVPYSGSTVVIKVRNGFSKLHKALVKRSPSKKALQVTDENYASITERGSISSIIQKPWGKEFVAYDYDGNKIIYVQTKFWLRSRF